jgi:hypothetical protein
MQSFHSKISILAGGNHLRYVPAAFAQALVAGGAATPQDTVGRIRAVTLTRPASTHAQRIGPPSDARGMGVRFFRVRALPESGALIYEHHPRCCWTEPDA